MVAAQMNSTTAAAAGIGNHRRWLIIAPPLLFLLVFFLIPFGFALAISFAQTAIRVPPYTDVLSIDHGHLHLWFHVPDP